MNYQIRMKKLKKITQRGQKAEGPAILERPAQAAYDGYCALMDQLSKELPEVFRTWEKLKSAGLDQYVLQYIRDKVLEDAIVLSSHYNMMAFSDGRVSFPCGPGNEILVLYPGCRNVEMFKAWINDGRTAAFAAPDDYQDLLEQISEAGKYWHDFRSNFYRCVDGLLEEEDRYPHGR